MEQKVLQQYRVSEGMVGDVATVLFLASRLETYPARLMRHQAIE
jgi:hypothetical protein